MPVSEKPEADVAVGAIEEPGFLSRRDVARLFGVSTSTVTRWAQKGLLRTVRTPGGHYRFPAGETRRAAVKAGLPGINPLV
jgi:excisionase family DNA binding protein